MEHSFDLTADRQHVHDAVKGLIWAIFFYRTFGSIEPAISEFLDVPYPYFDSPELDNEIEQKIDQLLSRIDSDISTPILSSTSVTSTPLGSPGAIRPFTLSSSNNSNPYTNYKFTDPDTLQPLSAYDHNSINEQQILPSSSSIHSLNAVTSNKTNSLKSPSSMPTTNAASISQTVSSRKQNSSSINSTNHNTNHNEPNSNVKFGQIAVKFYERKKLKKPTWFGKTEEEINWETWIFNIRVISNPSIMSINNDHHIDIDQFIENLKNVFEKTIWEISEKCDEFKDHIPIITSTDLFPFPYTISTSHGNNDSWKEFIKKMLKDPIY